MSTSSAPLYVIADIHGHRAETLEALRAAGLVDERGDWTGGDARLWFLGDYVDRGPEGVAVIDDIRRLAGQAPAADGHVGALLGNHEAQFLAADRFGDTPIEGWEQPGGFRGRWLRFGGVEDDMRGLTDAHRAWISSLPAIALVDEYLLLHSDTVRYLEFGASVEAVNSAVAGAMASEEAVAWLDLCARLASRGSFRDPDEVQAEEAIGSVLDTLGGEIVVHGHSTLISGFGMEAGEAGEALRYGGGRVIAVDGGVFEGGQVLLTRLR